MPTLVHEDFIQQTEPGDRTSPVDCSTGAGRQERSDDDHERYLERLVRQVRARSLHPVATEGRDGGGEQHLAGVYRQRDLI